MTHFLSNSQEQAFREIAMAGAERFNRAKKTVHEKDVPHMDAVLQKIK